jgi:hypothetical protein
MVHGIMGTRNNECLPYVIAFGVHGIMGARNNGGVG